MSEALRCVLFDLDGTLVDTAPDLGFALNTILAEEGRAALPLSAIRPAVSQGSIGLLQTGFHITPDAPSFADLQQRFLALYSANLVRETRLFPGMADLLTILERSGVQWGIVTNKATRFTLPLIEQLGLTQRAGCIVSGDTTPHAKPHPAPLLYACQIIDRLPAQCIYVGDARSDIEAGTRAGMQTLIASFGYIPAEEQPDAWGATGMIGHPLEIANWVSQAAYADHQEAG